MPGATAGLPLQLSAWLTAMQTDLGKMLEGQGRTFNTCSALATPVLAANVVMSGKLAHPEWFHYPPISCPYRSVYVCTSMVSFLGAPAGNRGKMSMSNSAKTSEHPFANLRVS